MKLFRAIVLGAFALVALGCDEDLDAGMELESASILSVTTIECNCCPGLSIAVGGDTIFVDSVPESPALNTALAKEEFPIDVLLKTSAYTGDCPNRDFEVDHIELSD